MIAKALYVLLCICVHNAVSYDYDTFYFRQQIDHFGYANNGTFEQRYLVAKDYWVEGEPLFFYTGNEGDIFKFANNTGLMWDWAPEFKAMLVFAEHRYYGKSLPYGKKAYNGTEHLGYLTTGQALADFAVLIDHLKATTPGLKNSPVILFGGSYGGMLAAWFRMKYPHVADGALCSSGPVLQFQGMTPCNVFNQIATKPFKQASPECSESIRKSWAIYRDLLKTPKTTKFLSDSFKFCKTITNETVNDFISWVQSTWVSAAMTNYPYPNSFLMPVPAYPVKEMCKELPDSTKSDKALLMDIIRAAGVFQNYTGQTECYDLGQPDGVSMGDLGWSFQSCTEMVMPMCSDGKNDMFEPTPWNFTSIKEDCWKKFGVTPQAHKAEQMFGGLHINASSKIIFSNGLLDPWSGGGIQKSLSDSLVAILIPEGAHHLDLRAANKDDPLSVINARKQEKQLITKWIGEAKIRRLHAA